MWFVGLLKYCISLFKWTYFKFPHWLSFKNFFCEILDQLFSHFFLSSDILKHKTFCMQQKKRCVELLKSLSLFCYALETMRVLLLCMLYRLWQIGHNEPLLKILVDFLDMSWRRVFNSCANYFNWCTPFTLFFYFTVPCFHYFIGESS